METVCTSADIWCLGASRTHSIPCVLWTRLLLVENRQHLLAFEPLTPLSLTVKAHPTLHSTLHSHIMTLINLGLYSLACNCLHKATFNLVGLYREVRKDLRRHILIVNLMQGNQHK
jgi:hypothetical protein